MKKLVTVFVFITSIISCKSEPIQNMYRSNSDSIKVDELIKAVYTLPFKYKKIVIAQAILETGWFTSKNFKVNNNLFGMKTPYTRVTTADSSINGYAHYSKWELSVIDYYLMISVRNDIINIKTEAEYYRYVDRIYSEVGISYSNQLKQIIEKLKLNDNDDEVKPKRTLKKKKKSSKHK